MDKIAQRRSMFQWLHEKANIPRRLTETFSNEYETQMEALREADSNARNQAKTLEYWLRSERRSLNKHHYIDVVYFANQISNVVNEIIHGYDGLRELKKKHEYEIIRQREHAPEEFLGANAGIISRYFEGRARRLLLGEQKKEMTRLYNESKKLIIYVLHGFKEMGSLRASGKVVEYLKEVDKLEKYLNDFNKLYSEMYDKYVKHLMPPKPSAPATDAIPAAANTDESAPPSEPFPLTTQRPAIQGPELNVEMDAVAPDLQVKVDAGPGIAPAIPKPTNAPETTEPQKSPATPEAAAGQQEVAQQSEPSKTPEQTVAPVKTEAEPPRKRTRRPKAEGEPTKPPKTKKAPKAADKIIIEMIKSGMAMGMSDKDIYSMLIEKSAEFDDDSEFSMKLLVVAEGFINE